MAVLGIMPLSTPRGSLHLISGGVKPLKEVIIAKKHFYETAIMFKESKQTIFWTKAVLGIFFIQLYQNYTACSPITYANCYVLYLTYVLLVLCSYSYV